MACVCYKEGDRVVVCEASTGISMTNSFLRDPNVSDEETRFSCYSEAFALEFLENFEGIFPTTCKIICLANSK